MWYFCLEIFSFLWWEREGRVNHRERIKRMKRKIKDRTASREFLVDILMLLQEKKVRTEDLRVLKVRDVEKRSISDICDIFIAELSLKRRGVKTFGHTQCDVLTRFLKTSDAQTALRKRKETLSEIPQKKAV
jgi:hypothetical protein